jgi:TatD DNase family protein
MHCFTGSAETAQVCVDMGLHVSFTGSVTFRNRAQGRGGRGGGALKPLMAETDCPYLSPEPVRGRRNDPSNVRYVIEKLAESRSYPRMRWQRFTSITQKDCLA